MKNISLILSIIFIFVGFAYGQAPPEESQTACTGKAENSPCSFIGPQGEANGTCAYTPDRKYFACRPERGNAPGQGPENGQGPEPGSQPGQQPGGTYLLPWLRPAKVWLDSELLSTTGTHDKDGNRVRTEAPANDLQDIPRQFLPRISRGQPLLNATKNFREWGEVIELVEGAVGKSNSSKFFGFAAKNCMVRSISSSKQLQEGPHTFFEVRFTIQLGDVASNKTAGGMFKVPHRAWLVKDPNGAGLIAAVKDGQLLAEPPYLNKTTGEMTQDETFTEVDYGNTFDFKKFKIDEPK